MSCSIQRFDGVAVPGVLSKTGVFLANDWRQLTLPPFGPPILGKARGSRSQLHSINSEDTVTWSVFGCAAEEGWLDEMLSEVFGPAERPRNCTVSLWKRTPHPRTGRTGHGPEADVVIESGPWRYVVEAKWTSGISEHTHGETQLDMRSLQASGVLVVTPSPAYYCRRGAKLGVFHRYFVANGCGYSQVDAARAVNAHALTWERLAEIIGTRGRPFLREYIAWRLSLIR